MFHSQQPVLKKKMRGALFEIGVLIALCASVVAFFVGSFAESLAIHGFSLALLYAVGSLLSVAGFVLLPKIIEMLGTKRALLAATTLYTFGLFGTSLAYSFTSLLIPFTCISLSFGVVLALLDIYVEHSTDSTHREGDVRGHYLALQNCSYILGPLAGGLVLNMGGYSALFIASSLFMIPAIGIIYEHLGEVDKAKVAKPATHSHIHHAGLSWASLTKIWHDKPLRDIYTFYMLLRVFFALIGIYSAIFLSTVHGFSFAAVGALIGISLIPMVAVELPVGKLLDGRWHHKHVGMAGFGIMAIGAAIISTVDSDSFLVWALLLVALRIGAALVEIVAETYFFSLAGRDTQKVGLFRATYPLSFLVGPALGAVAITIAGYSGLFTLISLLALYGAYVASEFKDTR
jgi:MFS family permease